MLEIKWPKVPIMFILVGFDFQKDVLTLKFIETILSINTSNVFNMLFNIAQKQTCINTDLLDELYL